MPLNKETNQTWNHIIVNELLIWIVVRVSEFELQSRNYVPFRANTLGKVMNPLILINPAMG